MQGQSCNASRATGPGMHPHLRRPPSQLHHLGLQFSHARLQLGRALAPVRLHGALPHAREPRVCQQGLQLPHAALLQIDALLQPGDVLRGVLQPSLQELAASTAREQGQCWSQFGCAPAA